MDAEDLPLLEPYGKFCAWWNMCTRSFYARARLKNSGTPGKIQYLHRIIMRPTLGMHVDHIDHNTLNNRKCNLRLVTRSQNQCNMRPQERNAWGYKGVSFCNRTGLWMAKIQVSGNQHWLGRHPSPELANAAYEEAAKKFHGEFAHRSGGFPSTGRKGSRPGP